METIKILVTGAHAEVVQVPAITTGMVGLMAEFAFDDTWDGLIRSALFRAGNARRMVPNIESSAPVASEVLQEAGLMLEVGIYGTSVDGTIVIPTVWVNVDFIQEGVDNDVETAVEPELPIWVDILAKINAMIDNNLQIMPKGTIILSDEPPAYGPVLWFDTGDKTPGALVFVDELNQHHVLDIRTKLEHVAGSDAVSNHLQNKENPHNVTMAQLLAQGPIVLGPEHYGDTLPQPGIPGRIFFKRVKD